MNRLGRASSRGMIAAAARLMVRAPMLPLQMNRTRLFGGILNLARTLFFAAADKMALRSG